MKIINISSWMLIDYKIDDKEGCAEVLLSDILKPMENMQKRRSFKKKMPLTWYLAIDLVSCNW